MFSSRKQSVTSNETLSKPKEIPKIYVIPDSKEDMNAEIEKKISKKSVRTLEFGRRRRNTLGSGSPSTTMSEEEVHKASSVFSAAVNDKAYKERRDTLTQEQLRSSKHKLALPGAATKRSESRRGTLTAWASVTASMTVQINKMSLKLYGSEKAVVEEQNRLQQAGAWIIHPYSNFRLLWDSITLVLLLVNIIIIPVAITFWKDDEPSWLPFKAVADIWFLLDIVFNFRTGIVIDGPDSDVILNPREIRSIYLKTWFAVDIISTFPFDLVYTLSSQEGVYTRQRVVSSNYNEEPQIKALGLLRLAKILALLRLLRLSRFIRYIRQWEEIFNFQYETALAFARIFNLIMLMLFICHFNGCLQYMVPMFLDFPEKTWVKERNLNHINISIWERYSWSVFKSTSHMLCIGYGQFPPQGMVDLWVTYVSMCSGAMCFALFIGNATSLIQSMDASKRAYKEKFVQVKEYMQFRKLPSHLRRRISDYYENRYQGKMFDEKKILSELNHALREEVLNSNCKELIEQVPLFNETDPYFLNAILAKLEFEVYLVDEIIVQEGSVGNKMYFISRGTVTIKSYQHNIEQSLFDGCYFGENSLLQPTARRTASVIADTYCYLYSLSTQDFQDVLKEFPAQRSKMCKVVQDKTSVICSPPAREQRNQSIQIGALSSLPTITSMSEISKEGSNASFNPTE